MAAAPKAVKVASPKVAKVAPRRAVMADKAALVAKAEQPATGVRTAARDNPYN